MRKQAQMTMRCMQALVRVQARVRARRLQLAHERLRKKTGNVNRGNEYYEEEEKEEEEEEEREEKKQNMRSPLKNLGGGWDGGPKDMEKLKENALRKHDAVIKRERALAYANYAYQVCRISLGFVIN